MGASEELWAGEGSAGGRQPRSSSRKRAGVRGMRSLEAVEKRQSGRGAGNCLSSGRRGCIRGIAGLWSYVQRRRRSVEAWKSNAQ